MRVLAFAGVIGAPAPVVAKSVGGADTPSAGALKGLQGTEKCTRIVDSWQWNCATIPGNSGLEP
jgi:hypothetical protein